MSNPVWAGGTHLHADDGVDEEQHGNEEAHVGQRLETHEHVSSRAAHFSLAQLHPLTTESCQQQVALTAYL